MTKTSFRVYPIGSVQREGDETTIQIDAAYRDALKQLDQFSHVIAFWWVSEHDNEQSRSILTCEPPYAQGHVTGLFACRSEYRPNPIAMSVCPIVSVDEETGRVTVSNIDAFDGTPVLDLKAYFPVCDRVQEAHIPSWLSEWPEWMPPDGIGLQY